MTNTSTWHVLQISAALDMELASALSETGNVLGWKPEPSLLPGLLPFHPPQQVERLTKTLTIRTFSRLRGYARLPISILANVGPAISRLLQSHSQNPEQDVLVCTTPFLVPVAERWRGPVVYWLTDRISDYESAHHIDVPALDRRMCAAATLVCPNSRRLLEYLIEDADCAREKTVVLPNAVRAQNLLPQPLRQPKPLPRDVAHHCRPIAGILGNMGANIDWVFLQEVVASTPWLTWLFVGPVQQDLDDAYQHLAREAVLAQRNACFLGKRPYNELVQYARTLNVAILPYRKREPTFSGSSTRFYEHLAACRPMLATRGFDELLEKEPLVKLVTTPQDMREALEHLRANQFQDGHEAARWKQSFSETWQGRAETMRNMLERRLQESRIVASDALSNSNAA